MIKTRLTETKDTDALLARMPIELREKQLKRALGRGVRVMAKEARRLAPVDDSDDDGVRIRRSIATRTKVRGPVVIASAFVKGQAASYSLALEYGHELIAWGKKTDQRVPEQPFFRPAADTTEQQQNRAVVNSLEKDVGELAR